MPIDNQYLLDYAQIRDVQERYFQAVDRNDEQGVRNCFAEDVRATYHARPLQLGVDAMMDNALHPFFKRVAEGLTKTSTHFMGNFRIEQLSGDAAETETYAIVALVHAGAPRDEAVIMAIRYLDRWRRLEQGWRIVERQQTYDWSCQQPVTFATAMKQRVSHLPPA